MPQRHQTRCWFGIIRLNIMPQRRRTRCLFGIMLWTTSPNKMLVVYGRMLYQNVSHKAFGIILWNSVPNAIKQCIGLIFYGRTLCNNIIKKTSVLYYVVYNVIKKGWVNELVWYYMVEHCTTTSSNKYYVF